MKRDEIYRLAHADAKQIIAWYLPTSGAGWLNESYVWEVYRAGLLLDHQQHPSRGGEQLDLATREHLVWLLGWCMLSIADLGGAPRDGEWWTPPGSDLESRWSTVVDIVDSERAYQDALWAPRHMPAGYLLMLHYYIEQMVELWVSNKGYELALNSVRKIAGICVRCLEEHGYPAA